MLAMYANFLASTNRGAQAIAMLKAVESNGSPQAAWEETMLFGALANCARSMGQGEEAAKYEALIRAKHAGAIPEIEVPVGDDLFQKAETAAKEGRPGEAFDLAMRALDATRRSENRQEFGWQIVPIAAAMKAKGDARMAEQLFQSAISMAQSWSEETVQAAIKLTSGRAAALIDDPNRRGEAWSAIERYRQLLVAAHGADSGVAEGALRMAAELGRPSVIPSLDLAAFEERVNGGTSEPYLQALEVLAASYEGNQDWEAAVRVRQRVVQLGELVYGVGDPQREQTRVDLAMALARLGRFDEAEALAVGNVSFEGALQQIRQMRAASGKK
jgi:tetratricopeptide (TPR) repeat protein